MDIFDLIQCSYADPYDLNTKTSLRGWSMRKGHRKGVIKRKRWHAYAPGAKRTGWREAGRSVYKRSCNSGSRWDGGYYGETVQDARKAATHRIRGAIAEDLEYYYYGEDEGTDMDEYSDDGCSSEGDAYEDFDSWERRRCYSNGSGRASSWSSSSGSWVHVDGNSLTDFDDFDETTSATSAGSHDAGEGCSLADGKDDPAESTSTTSTSCVSVSKRRTVAAGGWAVSVPLAQQQHNSSSESTPAAPAQKRGWRWDVAVVRAEQAAQQMKAASKLAQPTYGYYPSSASSAGGAKSGRVQVWPRGSSGNQRTSRQEKKRNKRLDQQHAWITQLVEEHKQLHASDASEAELVAQTNRLFEALRWLFLMRHRTEVMASVQRHFQNRVANLKPLDISPLVQLRFLKAWIRAGGLTTGSAQARLDNLMPLWHGTKGKNVQSIAERGLLIPGRHRNITVVNGSAHGVGIYTARVDSPLLSSGFACGGGLLVCAGLDDARILSPAEAHTVGNFVVHRESSAVRHVGSAVVFFDHRLVVPFFRMSLEEKNRSPKDTKPLPRLQRQSRPSKARGELARAASAPVAQWLLQAGRRRRMRAGAGKGAMWMPHTSSR